MPPQKIESNATFKFLRIFDSIDPNLTPDQRLERAAKILAPYVLEAIKEKQKGTVLPPTASRSQVRNPEPSRASRQSHPNMVARIHILTKFAVCPFGPTCIHNAYRNLGISIFSMNRQ